MFPSADPTRSVWLWPTGTDAAAGCTTMGGCVGTGVGSGVAVAAGGSVCGMATPGGAGDGDGAGLTCCARSSAPLESMQAHAAAAKKAACGSRDQAILISVR